MSWNFFGDNPREIAERARRLADDIELIARGDAPVPADLAVAPVLDRWRLVCRSTPSLVGIVSRHPNVGEGHRTLTSEVFALNTEHGLARTWSRLYVLGRSAGPDEGVLQ